MNENLINEIAQIFKVDPSKLSEVDSLSQIETPVKYFFSQDDYNNLAQGKQKDGYDTGKKAGEEMLFKSLKNNYLNDDSLIGKAFQNASNMNDFVSHVSDLHSIEKTSALENFKKDFNGDVDSRIGEWKEKYTALDAISRKEKEALQKLIADKENEYNQIIEEMKLANKQEKLNNYFAQESQILTFETPDSVSSKGEKAIADFNTIKRNNAITLFNARYKTDFDDNGNVYAIDRTTNEPVRDHTMNNVPVKDLLYTFATENHLGVKSLRGNGRGAGDKTNSATSLSRITNMQQFADYCTKENIKPNSSEQAKLYMEVLKNPNFKD